MSMRRICAISSWISFLISTDILSGDYFSATSRDWILLLLLSVLVSED